MFRAAVLFFILGIFSYFIGMNNIGGLSMEVGRMILIVFILFSLISFLSGFLRRKRVKVLTMSLLIFFAAATMSNSHFAQATETKEKVTEVANDSKRAVKKAVRNAKDKTCEMINGKMECAAKKVKHTVQNGVDKVEDAID